MTAKSSISRIQKILNPFMGLVRIVYRTFFLILAIALLVNCGDEEKKVRRGLAFSNLCFTTQGGDISNQIYCDEPWKIIVPDRAQTWIAVNPNSGTGLQDTTNLIITVTVNNNALYRTTPIVVIMGNDTVYYSAAQDGTIYRACYD